MALRADSKYIQGQGNEEGTVTINLLQPEGVALRYNEKYTHSLSSLLHFIQLAFSLTGLILLSSSGSQSTSLLDLPLNWHLRAYIFVSVLALLINIAVLLINISSLAEAFPLNWQMFDLIVYGIVSIVYCLCSSMVASAVRYYHTQHITSRTTSLLTAAIVTGFICFVLYGVSAILAARNLRQEQQLFASHRLPTSRQQSQNSDNTQDLDASRV